MKRTISFLLLIAVISLMTGCNSENNQVAAEESVSINLIPIYSHAKTKAETGILNLSNPFRPFYLFSGWSATYVLEENGPAFVAAIGKESILRYNIYKPHDRWFIFKVNNDGKYGGPNWQEMQIFSGDNLLGKYEVRKEEQEIQVYIPAEYQKVGENFLNLKFAILWDNPIWMAKREDHSEFPFPFICTYFNDLKFKTGSKEGPEYQETRDETDAFKLILDDKFLSQTPPARSVMHLISMRALP